MCHVCRTTGRSFAPKTVLVAVHFEVTILKDNARQKVLVDKQTGQVVKIFTADNDDEHHSDD